MKSLLFAVLLAISGVTIAAKADTNIILKDDECLQVATAVAKTLAKDPSFNMDTDKHMSQNAKIVSKYVITMNPEMAQYPPQEIFNFLFESCTASEGKTTIPENV